MGIGKVVSSLIPTKLLERVYANSKKESLPDKLVIKRYLEAGELFCHNYCAVESLGETDKNKKRLNDLVEWEKEYSMRGYRTLQFNDLIYANSEFVSIRHLISQKRVSGEEPILRAEKFKELYLSEIPEKRKYELLGELFYEPKPGEKVYSVQIAFGGPKIQIKVTPQE